jgi:hypothetical protein
MTTLEIMGWTPTFRTRMGLCRKRPEKNRLTIEATKM